MDIFPCEQPGRCRGKAVAARWRLLISWQSNAAFLRIFRRKRLRCLKSLPGGAGKAGIMAFACRFGDENASELDANATTKGLTSQFSFHAVGERPAYGHWPWRVDPWSVAEWNSQSEGRAAGGVPPVALGDAEGMIQPAS
jgi:hypothetical protein